MTNKAQFSAPPPDGVLALNKPSGPSSAACLNFFKKLGQKKIGHAGTLDPLASGVLIVLLGQATKISSWLMAGGEKIYTCRARLGITTDTWDITGATLAESDWSRVDEADIRREIELSRGETTQVVPPFSAAKYRGQPLYKLARAGRPAPLKTKTIVAREIELIELDLPYFTFRVVCGSGAYIRSLAHSLGTRLGCGAAVTELTREYSHPFGIADAVDPETLRANPEALPTYVRSIADALPAWRRVALDARDAGRVRQGMPIPADPDCAEGEKALLMENGAAIALALNDGGQWLTRRGLWN